MAIVNWDGSLKTGIETIDSQHAHLFEVINNLHDKINRGEDKVYLLTTLDSLRQYVRFHFRTEEALMVRNDYPETDRHIASHRSFEAKVGEFETSMEHNVGKLLMETLSYLLGWIVTHIQQEDRLLATYLKKVS